ncbi:unnamed protein product [Phytophthora fragariaefolia]|uniref:Unnamed protein product n=1 Tax=Phytophthora fragariaefolia TaxID=1490495 RepID=A0A9W6XFZ6_9STRA|nr:unnamed protein product [Phytophthora fragariaefolia]
MWRNCRLQVRYPPDERSGQCRVSSCIHICNGVFVTSQTSQCIRTALFDARGRALKGDFLAPCATICRDHAVVSLLPIGQAIICSRQFATATPAHSEVKNVNQEVYNEETFLDVTLQHRFLAAILYSVRECPREHCHVVEMLEELCGMQNELAGIRVYHSVVCNVVVSNTF